MRVFVNESHALHAPGWYLADGTVRPVPECPARMEWILGAIREVKGLEIGGVGGADAWPAIRAVHSAAYLEYLRTIHGMWFAEFGCDVMPDTFPRRAGGKVPRKASAQAGYFCFDMAAPITAGTWECVLNGARCAVSAAEEILGGGRFAFALSRPPGHHAGADYCGGFCFLNYAAIAAQHLIMRGMKRVAVLDVDYHHGNGTQDIFYARRDVLFVSIHAEPDTQYPYFWGHAEEQGEGEGVGFNVNFPLPRGTNEAEWMKALDAAMVRVLEFEPEAVVVSLGVDTYENDDVGDFGLSVMGFGELGRRLARLPVPCVLVQEGGYHLEAVGECVAAVLSGMTASL